MRGEGVKHQKRKLPLQKFTKGKNYTSKKKTFRDPSTIWHFLFTTRHPNKNPIFIKIRLFIITHFCRGLPKHKRNIIQSYKDLIRRVSIRADFLKLVISSRKLVEFIRKIFENKLESDPDILLAPTLQPNLKISIFSKSFRICIWVFYNYSKYIIYRIKQHFTKDQIKI